ncbi:regenerating islet-derived protein 4-like protein [Aphelenchoides avenae]|nr:regenerating islet-derived protein 4-like protein [Aphelenchus avenae]
MTGGYLFIGLRVASGHWRWTDGSKTDYTHWRAGAPDNAGGRQFCAVIDTKLPYGGWDDIQCDATLITVCKKPAQQ